MFKYLKKPAVIVLLGLIFAIVCLNLLAGKKAEKIQYGVTFSYPYAQMLGIDWKRAYERTVQDLGFKTMRLPVYWNLTEPEKGRYDFENLDYQVRLAENNNVKLVLSVGNRVPRWPECHTPGWAKSLSEDEFENRVLSFIETVVLRYKASGALEIWQVENEPFLSGFGECPPLRPELLDKEISLVKKLDPGKPVLISDSGELSMWLEAGKKGDIFGTTFYRYVYSDVFKRYWVNYVPYWVYRLRAGMLRLFNPKKPIYIIELQSEAWTTNGINSTPIEEQYKTMSMEKFESVLGAARATGFEKQYLWGVEWWYWMEAKGHPEFLEKVKILLAN